MNSDEVKGLRIQRSKLMAELERVNTLLNQWDLAEPTWTPKSAQGTPREDFYRQAERDSIRSGSYRNTDSNGNYVTPEDK
jgi:hypothetical protein